MPPCSIIKNMLTEKIEHCVFGLRFLSDGALFCVFISFDMESVLHLTGLSKVNRKQTNENQDQQNMQQKNPNVFFCSILLVNLYEFILCFFNDKYRISLKSHKFAAPFELYATFCTILSGLTDGLLGFFYIYSCFTLKIHS